MIKIYSNQLNPFNYEKHVTGNGDGIIHIVRL